MIICQEYPNLWGGRSLGCFPWGFFLSVDRTHLCYLSHMSRWELPRDSDSSCVSADCSMEPSSWSESSGKICWALDLFLLSFLYFSLLNPPQVQTTLSTSLADSHPYALGVSFLGHHTQHRQSAHFKITVCAYESEFRFPVVANPHDRERLNVVLSNGLIKQCRGRRKLGMS